MTYRQPVDAIAARELVLFATNESALYHRRAQPIIKNLARKMAKDTYNHDLACKAWRYLADDAAKVYAVQYGGSFNVPTRDQAAFWLCDHYFDAVEEESLSVKLDKQLGEGDFA